MVASLLQTLYGLVTGHAAATSPQSGTKGLWRYHRAVPSLGSKAMAGLDATTPIPTDITLRRKSKILEIVFADGSRFELPFEFLRVYSPSAEVRGHGVGQEVLQQGKEGVDIVRLEPVGAYAIKPTFSDGHES